MNHYVGKFVFHPVGHGLFYTGEITDDSGESFSFAFDCGSENEQIVLDIINNGLLPNGLSDILPEHIDLLIISHFHADHISGALELIKKKRISKVILPYLTDTTKILYASKMDSSFSNGSNLVNFISDPTTVIKEINENCEVHLLNENESSDFNRLELWDSEREPFEFKWTDKLNSNSNLYQHAGNVSLVSPIWEFRFYMPKIGDKDQIQKLKDFFSDNSITIDNARNHFSEIEAKMDELKLDDNISNIVCAHGPSSKLLLGAIENNITPYPLSHPFPWIWHPYYYYRRHPFLSEFRPIQFLNGDAEIDDKNAFRNRYKDQLLRSILFQIPHHGSKKNWDDIFCKWQPFCNLWPVTHNRTNKRKGRGIFPSANFSFISVRPITDDPYSKLEFRIHFFKEK